MDFAKNPMKFVFSLVLPIAFVAATSTGVAQEEQQEQEKQQQHEQQRAMMGQQCEATLELASFAPQENTIHLNALLTQDIGEVQEISIEEQSGLRASKGEMTEIERQAFEQRRQGQQQGQPQDQPQDDPAAGGVYGQGAMATASPVRVHLDTENATEGTWTITFNGQSGTCTAKVQVGQDQQQQYEQQREEQEQQGEEEEGWPPLM